MVDGVPPPGVDPVLVPAVPVVLALDVPGVLAAVALDVGVVAPAAEVDAALVVAAPDAVPALAAVVLLDLLSLEQAAASSIVTAESPASSLV